MIAFDNLATEKNNPASAHIDEMTTLDMITLINREDQKAALSLVPILPQIAAAVDLIADRLRRGGRLIYCGAGTSGRLGVLDATECPPTYGTDPRQVTAIIAGGRPAMFAAQEGAEDNMDAAVADLQELQLNRADVLVGLSASGRAPYVVSALRYAGAQGAATVSVACSPGSVIARAADISLTAVPGPEIIAGSTRLKAGTVQKLILNMLSTGAMIRLGKVFGNRMVDLQATNEKLAERARRIVSEVIGCPAEESAHLLKKSDGSAKLAILLGLSRLSPEDARRILQETDGHLKAALRIAQTRGGET